MLNADEIGRLKQENSLLAERHKNLSSQLSEKKKEAEKLNKSSFELKETLLRCVSEENNLQHEIEFLETEKTKLANTHDEASKSLDSNMAVLEDMIKDIEFMKGELGTLKVKLDMLEQEIPEKFRDADNLDRKITGAFFTAIEDLSNRMNAVEKKIKILYYKKENV